MTLRTTYFEFLNIFELSYKCYSPKLMTLVREVCKILNVQVWTVSTIACQEPPTGDLLQTVHIPLKILNVRKKERNKERMTSITTKLPI